MGRSWWQLVLAAGGEERRAGDVVGDARALADDVDRRHEELLAHERHRVEEEEDAHDPHEHQPADRADEHAEALRIDVRHSRKVHTSHLSK